MASRLQSSAALAELAASTVGAQASRATTQISKRVFIGSLAGHGAAKISCMAA